MKLKWIWLWNLRIWPGNPIVTLILQRCTMYSKLTVARFVNTIYSNFTIVVIVHFRYILANLCLLHDNIIHLNYRITWTSVWHLYFMHASFKYFLFYTWQLHTFLPSTFMLSSIFIWMHVLKYHYHFCWPVIVCSYNVHICIAWQESRATCSSRLAWEADWLIYIEGCEHCSSNRYRCWHAPPIPI